MIEFKEGCRMIQSIYSLIPEGVLIEIHLYLDIPEFPKHPSDFMFHLVDDGYMLIRLLLIRGYGKTGEDGWVEVLP